MNLWSKSVCLIAVICALLFGGCAGEKPAPSITSQPGGSAPKRPKVEPAVATTLARRSTFTLDASSRDPFYPQPKKPQVQEPRGGGDLVGQPQPPTDLAALLSAGLQGIGGTTDRRMAIIYNTVLEPGRRTEIPVKMNNQDRRLSVKCREIAKTTVALDVEGYGLVVVKAKSTL